MPGTDPCFSYVLLQERRRYGALGWNCAHAFNITDLEAGMIMAHILLRDSPAVIPWTALQQAITRFGASVAYTLCLTAACFISRECFRITSFYCVFSAFASLSAEYRTATLVGT